MTQIDLAEVLKNMLRFDDDVCVLLAYADQTRQSKTIIVRVPALSYVSPDRKAVFANVEISGMTFTSEDPDRAELNDLLAATERQILSWSPENVTQAICREGVCCDGLFDYAVNLIDTADSFVFTSSFTMAIQFNQNSEGENL